MLIYLCEDSLEGVFSAVYKAYEEKRNPLDTALSLREEPFLFAEYQTVLPDAQRTGKVMNTLLRRFGEENTLSLCLALTSADAGKAQAVYRTVADGLGRSCGKGRLFDNLAAEPVQRAFSLARSARRELHHLRGFVRFEELERKALYGVIAPKHNLLTFLMPHFADRLPMEHFLLYDEKRDLFGVHPAGREWYLLRGEEAVAPPLKRSEREEQYQELFRQFCQSVAIQSRRNPALQKQMLPLRYREYMTEWKNQS